MEKFSFSEEIEFDENRVKTKVILETPFSKEIRILLKSGQIMKEHKTPFPILIHILEGKIELGIQGKIRSLKTGDIMAIDGDVAHDLRAIEDTILRLTLSKQDTVKRLETVIGD